jgi:acid phosphatase type 7
MVARGPVSRLLYLGDVYGSGTAEEFANEYASTYGRLARVTAPTSGNHDAENETTGYDPYWRRVHGVRPPDWYAFRAGGWTIIGLDSEEPHDRGSAQHRWLRRQVRAPGTCRIAFWHRPRFSASDKHGDQPDMEPLLEALRGRAAIVVGGHDHDMQRFRPIDGITHFVSGAGGHGLYDLNRDRRLAFGDDRNYGALRLDLRAGTARHAFVAANGRTLDTGTIRCRPVR